MVEPDEARVARSWTSPQDVYVDDVLYPAGVRFTTAAPRGSTWVPADGPVRSRGAR